MQLLNIRRIMCHTFLVVYLSTSLALAASSPIQTPWNTGANHSPQTPAMARTLWAYISDQPSSKIIQCTADPTSGTFSHCSDAGATGLSSPTGIALNRAGTRAFVVNYGKHAKAKAVQCTVNPTSGKFSNCSDTHAKGLNGPGSLIFNHNETRVFITNSGGHSVIQCAVDPTSGTFSSCANAGLDGIKTPEGLTLNPTGTRLFITDWYRKKITQCKVDPTTGKVSSCASTGATRIISPNGIVLNSDGTRAFVVNYSYSKNQVIQCTVDPTSGKFSHCSDTGANSLKNPHSMVLNAAGTRAFMLVDIHYGEKENVATCAVNPSTGAFSNCKQTGATKLLLPGGITLSPTGA
ncbi:YncE family protein [Candidatus Sororendozoicomonas aggregata]|uniref:YncE family protein n=1 Tax=Candidatus Sororendozoicomonas aggregata TaxID=3073239 RepID=UPI002ED472A4